MAKIKSLFDADILIRLLETGTIDVALKTLGKIYIGEYVFKKRLVNIVPMGKK